MFPSPVDSIEHAVRQHSSTGTERTGHRLSTESPKRGASAHKDRLTCYERIGRSRVRGKIIAQPIKGPGEVGGKVAATKILPPLLM